MTWKEFKEKVEGQGVRDGDLLNFIDWSSDFGADVLVTIINNHEIEITEKI